MGWLQASELQPNHVLVQQTCLSGQFADVCVCVLQSCEPRSVLLQSCTPLFSIVHGVAGSIAS
jgi:hypothetical protein